MEHKSQTWKPVLHPTRSREKRSVEAGWGFLMTSWSCSVKKHTPTDPVRVGDRHQKMCSQSKDRKKEREREGGTDRGKGEGRRKRRWKVKKDKGRGRKEGRIGRQRL